MSADLMFREHTWDRNIWQSVNEGNEYGLTERFLPTDCVLDIGAHIGAFTYRCLDMGAGRVVAVEPDPANFSLLHHNLHVACRATDRALLLPAAAAIPDPDGNLVSVYAAGGGTNTGGVNTIGSNGTPVLALPLNELIRLATCWRRGSTLRLLKLDCEGMEWPLLEHGKFAAVNSIVGEWHSIYDPYDFPLLQLSGPRDEEWLKKQLGLHGFRVATKQTSPSLGLFWGWKD